MISSKEDALQGLKDNPDFLLDQVDLKERARVHLNQMHIYADLSAKERREIIQMRGVWSRWILGSILAIIVFDFFVITMLGFGLMNFSNGFIIPAFIGDSILKTLGLAAIVVKFLFSKDSTK